MLYPEVEYKRIFNDADKDRDGYITFDDLHRIVREVDHMFPEDLLRKCFKEAKIRIPPADKMDYQEFIEAMGKINWYFSRSYGVTSGTGPILHGQLSGFYAYYLSNPRFARRFYEEFFYETDTDNDGFITFEEFQVQARKYKLEYLERTIRLEFKKHNTRGDGYMDLTEFLIAMGFKMTTKIEITKKTVTKTTAPPPVKVEPPKPKTPKFQLGASLLRQIFMSMDQDGDGVLNKDELREVFKQLGQEMTDPEIEAMIAANDKEGDGCLTYDEFINSVMPTVQQVE